jgi:hypothetical protein
MCKLSQEKLRVEEHGWGYNDTYTFELNVEYFSFKRVLNPDIEQQMSAKEISLQEFARIYSDLKTDLKYGPNVVSQTVEQRTKDEKLEVKLFDNFMNAMPGDGIPASQTRGQFTDERFGVDRQFLFDLKKCDNPSQQIFTNKQYFDATKDIKENGEKIIIPIAHKKIMFDIQNKINILKTLI